MVDKAGMAHHPEPCPEDDDVEWKVFALLSDDTIFCERFHSIGRKCNVRGVQAFQVPRIWNEALGKREGIDGRCTWYNSFATPN